jgi:hypothetical protein
LSAQALCAFSAHGSPCTSLTGKKLEKLAAAESDISFSLSSSNMDKTEAGANYEKEWESALAKYAEKYPEEAKEFKQLISGELPAGWEKALPVSRPSCSRLLQSCLLVAASHSHLGIPGHVRFCLVASLVSMLAGGHCSWSLCIRVLPPELPWLLGQVPSLEHWGPGNDKGSVGQKSERADMRHTISWEV